MSEIISRLRQDHEDLSRLLSILAKQAENLASGAYTDYQVITDIMHYIISYPNVYHHPGEDAVMAVLKETEVSASDLIDEIFDEHKTMNDESNEILDEMIQIQGNAIFSRDELVGRLQAFIRNYYSHIEKEEKEVFPLALSRLTDADWKTINTNLGSSGTRDFGSILDNEYKNLYNFIMSEDVS